MGETAETVLLQPQDSQVSNPLTNAFPTSTEKVG